MANGNAKIIEFDNTGTRSSGELLKQSTSAFSQAQIAGNYAFGFSGTNAAAARQGLAGAMLANGAGQFTNGLLDMNDAGTVQNVTFTGTYTGINPATGRGTATIAITGQGTTNYSFYVVSATQLLMMEIDFVSGQVSPIVSGSLLQQAVPFGSSSLSGASVLQTSAISGGTTQSQVGLFSGDGGGNFNVNTNENTGGVLTLPSCTGTYTVDPSSGRVALTYSGTACAENVLYMVSTNEGFVMGTDTNVTVGFMENQSGPFTAASLSGSYAGGSAAPLLSSTGTQVDIAVADGITTVGFTTDSSTSSGLTQNQTTTGTFTVNPANGSGTITVGSETEILYFVSATEFVSLVTAGPQVTEAAIEHFQQ
jgi:hypothetical protein